MNGLKPDWKDVFDGRGDRQYSLVVLDNSTGIPSGQIASFDYESLLQRFSRPLHLSRMNFREFPLFGFLFLETSNSSSGELDWILHSDLQEFVKKKS